MSIDLYEKKDLVELLQDDGLELTTKHGDTQYFVATCPLHDDKNPSFVVYPQIQRWTCFSCKPGWHDSIDFFRQKYGWDFVKARDHCCTELDSDEALRRHLQNTELDGTVDMLHITSRMYDMVELHGLDYALPVLRSIDNMLTENRWVEVERVLRQAGV